MNTNLERLSEYLAAYYVTEQQAEFFVNLLNDSFRYDYKAWMDFMLTKEDQRKIDSATPSQLNDCLAKILPRDQFPQLAYDYRNEDIYGRYLNLDRLFLTKMYSLFRG